VYKGGAEIILPCETCKHRVENKQGFRVFIECDDKEREKSNFHYNDFTYHHSCTAFEADEMDYDRLIQKS